MIENLEAGKEKIFAANRIDLAAAKHPDFLLPS